jgi:AcrR family transcriptional regulator
MSDQVASRKYHAILKTGYDLLWKFGIRRVSIEEICREAGVSKMTFYRFFSNKTELAKTVIKNLFDKILYDYRELMARDIPFEDKIRQQLMMKFESANELSAELIKDIYGNPETEIFKYWETRADELMQIVINDYKNAQKMGWIRKDVKLDFIFYMSNKAIEMASDEKLQAMYPNMQSLIMEIANMFFYGIMPQSIK